MTATGATGSHGAQTAGERLFLGLVEREGDLTFKGFHPVSRIFRYEANIPEDVADRMLFYMRYLHLLVVMCVVPGIEALKAPAPQRDKPETVTCQYFAVV